MNSLVPNDDAGRIRILEAQLRECFGRVVYSHKTHEKCVDILLKRLQRIKLTQIVMSAITTAGFLTTILGGRYDDWGAAIGGLFSVGLLALNSYTKDYDIGELAQKHKQAANNIWILREKYLSLLTDIRTGVASLDDFGSRRDALLEDLHGVYEGAPSTNFKAYTFAQKALQHSEDLTFSDAEIDAFLPNELRKGGR